jgi:hypothetical protein
MKIRTAQQMRGTESIRPQEVRTAQQTQATESIRLHEGPNADAVIGDSGSTLYNRPDTRVASRDALQRLLEVLVAGLNARSHVRTPPMQI